MYINQRMTILAIFRYCSEKRNKEKVAPGIYLNLCHQFKDPSLSIWVLKMRLKNIFWPKTNLLQPQFSIWSH